MFTISLLLLYLFIITILLPKTYDCLDSSLFFSLISSISTPISSYHIFSYLFLSFLIYPFPFLFLFSHFYPSLLFFSFLFYSFLFSSFLFFSFLFYSFLFFSFLFLLPFTSPLYKNFNNPYKLVNTQLVPYKLEY